MTKPFRPMVPRLEDWSQHDIVAELRKRGTTLTALSRENGYGKDSLRVALRKPWPAAELIIARALGVHPAAIWPSRYGPDGESTRRKIGKRGPRYDLRKHVMNDTPAAPAGDTQAGQAW